MTRQREGRLADLVQQVTEQARDDAPLVRLSTAVEVASDLAAVADDLVEHFVAQARDAGCSWTQIGSAFGVSKQAAQQRFLPFNLSAIGCREIERRLTPRAGRAIRQAHKEARRMRVRSVDTEQLLLGLLRDSHGLASKTIEEVGVHAADVEREVERRFATKPDGALQTSGTLTSTAVTALQRAVAESEALAHNYVGTEHLLLGLVAEHGIARDALASLGTDYATVRDKLVEFLAGPEVVVGRRTLRARLQR